MKKAIVMITLLFNISGANAQQAPQQQSPAEIAIQLTNVIGAWAQTLTQQGKVIEDLHRQLATANSRIKELEKSGEAKPGNK